MKKTVWYVSGSKSSDKKWSKEGSDSSAEHKGSQTKERVDVGAEGGGVGEDSVEAAKGNWL